MNSVGPGPQDWFAAARDSQRAAQVLMREHLWRNAYGAAGHAVECSLKGLIMLRERMNRWPDRAARPDLYTHDLTRLATLAGVHADLLEEVRQQTEIGRAWMVARDFAILHRYPDGAPFPVRLGRDMVEAVGSRGLLQWLTTKRR